MTTLDRLTPTIGATVTGVDLNDVRTRADGAPLRAALAEHKLLVFPGQSLTPTAHRDFAAALGETTRAHPVVPGLDAEHPEIYVLDSGDGGKAPVWHTDVTFMAHPPLGSVLRAVTLPPTGGDTCWTDLEAAYLFLSPVLRDLADRLTALHDGREDFDEYLRDRLGGEGNTWEGQQVRSLEPVPHPVVRVHPETGRRSLFVNPGFTTRLVEVTEPESRALLAVFFAAIGRPEFTVRHRWSPGDVVVWDNRSTAHYAVDDYGDQQRVMHRITLRGDRPVGV
ncbi:TauD/TfdA dioxygenase family protein [Actinokineospora globicatena]|uniref:TauD/TfdA dioxygenase family protein n=1 Tax=Actinokineospora globicatena TaxID=103729 RepID=UPI0020A4AD2C|nr:TauD/TfdA family dioxygenase [Actinokineospora globicatena]MCP2303310.1 taurine dioxygenase [Actinokineospora globicatena]GLW79560.1 taurine dioxygenase [Actinokineospora globicatena]GLW86030.1 taurine dioxygenase [Actinokineospora globicatena]